MVDEHDIDGVDDASVTLAFEPDIEGWPTAQHTLDAFLENKDVSSGGQRGPGWCAHESAQRRGRVQDSWHREVVHVVPGWGLTV